MVKDNNLSGSKRASVKKPWMLDSSIGDPIGNTRPRSSGSFSHSVIPGGCLSVGRALLGKRIEWVYSDIAWSIEKKAKEIRCNGINDMNHPSRQRSVRQLGHP